MLFWGNQMLKNYLSFRYSFMGNKNGNKREGDTKEW